MNLFWGWSEDFLLFCLSWRWSPGPPFLSAMLNAVSLIFPVIPWLFYNKACKLKDTQRCQTLVAHCFNPSTKRQEDLCELEVSLVYRGQPGLHRETLFQAPPSTHTHTDTQRCKTCCGGPEGMSVPQCALLFSTPLGKRTVHRLSRRIAFAHAEAPLVLGGPGQYQ